MAVVACLCVALAMKRKSGFVVDTERAIQLSLIDSFEACDLCGLVLKACDLINKSPLLADFNYHEMSKDERARMLLGALCTRGVQSRHRRVHERAGDPS